MRETPWGAFSVAAFEHAGGTSLEEVDLRDEVLVACGRALGRCTGCPGGTSRACGGGRTATCSSRWHRRSRPCRTRGARLPSWRSCEDYLAALPVDTDDYGLVHYDFESDNVFVGRRRSRAASSISMMPCTTGTRWTSSRPSTAGGTSWARRLSSGPAPRPHGSGREVQLNDEMLRQLPAFQRFADLYCYTRIVRSAQETWHHEPDWLELLRVKLSAALETRSERFGTPLEEV